MRSITFVALLYIMAFVGWMIGGGELFEKLRFEMDEATAVMTSADPRIAQALKYNPKDTAMVDVVFTTDEGQVPVSRFGVRPRDLKTLAAGNGVTLRFRRSNPRDVLYGQDEKPLGLVWLAIGAIATGLAIYAHRLLRRQTG